MKNRQNEFCFLSKTRRQRTVKPGKFGSPGYSTFEDVLTVEVWREKETNFDVRVFLASGGKFKAEFMERFGVALPCRVTAVSQDTDYIEFTTAHKLIIRADPQVYQNFEMAALPECPLQPFESRREHAAKGSRNGGTKHSAKKTDPSRRFGKAKKGSNVQTRSRGRV